VAQLLEVCQRHIIDRVASPIDWSRFWRTPGQRRFERSRDALYRIVDELCAQRARRTDDPPDLYSVLMASGLPHQVLRDQLITLFLVGHETSASTLTWLFYALARHPAIADAVARESAAALARGPLTAQRLPELELTRRVVKEALRLYPAAPFMGREAIADDELAGYHIPKDTVVVMSPYATHRRPDLWPDPERFDPDRFTPENVARQLPNQFIPFLEGPRACIGRHLAMWELEIGLATIAARYRLTLVDDAPVDPIALISLRPSRPVVMRVEERT